MARTYWTDLALAVAVALLCANFSVAAEVKVGDQAPEIKAEKWFNTPKAISLAELKGKVVVVEFWATWCPPCRKSIPHINELHKKFKEKGVVIIGLSNESPNKVEEFINSMNSDEKNKKMEYIVGAGSKDSEQYGVKGIPHAFLVNPEGKVVWKGHPMVGLDKEIEKALSEVRPKEGKP